MKHARFYCKAIGRQLAELTGAEAHHLADVLRLRAGDKAELFDGAGTLAEAVVSEIIKERVVLSVEKMHRHTRRQSGRIVIAAAMAKGERFDWLIGKCTELGVDRICPVLFERSTKRPKPSLVTERYERIALAAAKQCGRLFLPQIDRPAAFEECLQTLTKDYPDAQLLAGSCGADAVPLIQFKYTGADIIAFVGPEGAMTEQEQQLLAQQRATPVRLTETVLRVETAAVAFAAILAAQHDATDSLPRCE